MKRIALNRKNSLFVGNARGGETAAILSSFTSTCRRYGLDPQVYFTQLLTNLPTTPLSQLDNWLPDQWQPPMRGVSFILRTRTVRIGSFSILFAGVDSRHRSRGTCR